MAFSRPQGAKRALSLSIVFSLVLVLFACQSKADSNKAPDFTLLNLQGDTVTLDDYKGKVIVLNFFATYCPPCRAEIPDFVKLQEEYRNKGLIVIGISVDSNGMLILPTFINRLGINYPILLATNKVLKDYGNIDILPTTFIIDRQQRIIKQYTGMITRADVTPVIEKALGKAA